MNKIKFHSILLIIFLGCISSIFGLHRKDKQPDAQFRNPQLPFIVVDKEVFTAYCRPAADEKDSLFFRKTRRKSRESIVGRLMNIYRINIKGCKDTIYSLSYDTFLPLAYNSTSVKVGIYRREYPVVKMLYVTPEKSTYLDKSQWKKNGLSRVSPSTVRLDIPTNKENKLRGWILVFRSPEKLEIPNMFSGQGTVKTWDTTVFRIMQLPKMDSISVRDIQKFNDILNNVVYRQCPDLYL